ncbi:RcpC/CpaB family pilus assembly protein [Streptomyces sp. MP131-18]|uniref:RcpC/CpaB family pilus assembly protein n=1 Tax=Streptomyces sp. MP131-18 TaxID=1857892 RepID=UPI0009CEF0F3|nr:Flp pilus assembly protein CpaB [Streptomyces sp. MP131-18]
MRPRGGRGRLRRALRRHRRAVAAALAVTAAALAVAAPRAAGPAPAAPAEPAAREGPPGAGPGRGSGAADDRVLAPVRITDADAVRLLRPGDRVDVLAATADGADASAAPARVVAGRARVVDVPEAPEAATAGGVTEAARGALLVLSVPPGTAAALAGAAATADLAVTKW